MTTVATSTQCPVSYSVAYDSVHGGCTLHATGGGVISVSSTTVTTLASLDAVSQLPRVWRTTACTDRVRCMFGGGVISVNGTTVNVLASSSQCPSTLAVLFDGFNNILYAACANGIVVFMSWSCPAGFEFGVADASCTPCNPGFASNSTQEDRIACAAGFYAPLRADHLRSVLGGNVCACGCQHAVHWRHPGYYVDSGSNLYTAAMPCRHVR